MALPFNMNTRQGGEAAYISREEAQPLIETHRQKISRLTYCCDGTRFPRERHVDILPFVGSKKDVLAHMSPKRQTGKKLRLFDIWRV